MKRVCVFCGSRNGTRDQYVASARQEDPERLLDALSRWKPPALERWMGREEI